MTLPDMTADDAMTTVRDKHGHAFAMKTMHCPICGPGRMDVVGWRGGGYHRHGQGVESRIVQCHSCRLMFPNPFPLPLDPQKLYGEPQTYFAGQDTQVKVGQCREIVQQLARRVASDDWSLLDVGCGCGEMLYAAALEGVQEAIGLDFSAAMVRFARETYGVDARVQMIEAFAGETGQVFDAVTLCGILEHVYDPDSFVASLAKVTKVGSWVYLDIPQEPNLLTMVGNAWNRLTGSQAVYNLSPTWLPFHVFGFSLQSLQTLFKKHGFVIRGHRAWAAPELPSEAAPWDRLHSFVGTQINRIANLTGTAHNMTVWVQRV